MINSLIRLKGSLIELEGNTVRPKLFPASVNLPVKQPIAIRMNGSAPYPTGSSIPYWTIPVDFRFKAFAFVFWFWPFHKHTIPHSTRNTEFIGAALQNLLKSKRRGSCRVER